VNAQDAANNILVDLAAESQRDLLSNALAAPSRDCAVSWLQRHQ
jgi:hypothetical protein